MKKALCIAGLSMCLTAGALAQDVSVAVTGAQIVASGVTAAAPRYMRASGANTLIVANQTTTSNADFRILSIDISGTPTATVLANAADFNTAITNAGGSAPSAITFRGMEVAQNGNVILASDENSTSVAWLFKITAPHTVTLLSGRQATNTVDGVNRLGVVGNTAVLLCNDAFAAAPQNTDHLQSFDITAASPAGDLTGSELVSQATLQGAIAGSTTANVVLNAPATLSSTSLLFANSGSGGTDELLTVSNTGTLALAKSKASLIADVADTDVGFGSAAYQANTNTVFLINNFGGTATDDDVIAVANGGTGTASIFVSDTTVEADADWPASTQFNPANDGVAIIGNNMYFADFNANQIFKMTLPGPAGVEDWQLF